MNTTEPRPPLPTVADWCRDESLAPVDEWLTGWVATEGEADEDGAWAPLFHEDDGTWTWSRNGEALPEGVRVVAWAPAPELSPPSVRYTTTFALLEAFKREERRVGAASAFRTSAELAVLHMEEPFRQAQKTPRPPGSVAALRIAWEDVVKDLRDLAVGDSEVAA